MNKTKLKSYAPQAREDFIAAVTARAHLLGISNKAGKLEVAASQPRGDATVIAGQAWPIKVHSQRQQLIARIEKEGFDQTMEAVAYTWFNRFAALRYMELHDYLGHGHRALSSLDGMLPDILTHATDLVQSNVLPGLNATLIVDMKLAGNRDGELYRLLLIAQCNALSNVMPFLFERIDDETELLLPDNLLRTDSVIAKLVSSIEEDEWKEVEIIGWLYQFYISDKKDDVIGKVVKSEDIPAATQLFTPKWIVQYLVQNSVGRLWLMANPSSNLKVQWPYYVVPANQPVEVQAQLDTIIQARVDKDGESLNPESITLLDPACGSGHILVEAYEVIKVIYLERGYQPRAIPRLILENNLYGLDIDDRAAQMAGFALLMKARADDRRLFNEPIKLNVLSLQESKGLDAEELTRALEAVAGGVSSQIVDREASSGFCEDDLFPGTRPQFSLGEPSVAGTASGPLRPAIVSLIATFADAKTFGSLIQVPKALNAQLAAIADRLKLAVDTGDLYAKAAAHDLRPLVAQAQVLGMQFDSVVGNPPYMGGKWMNQKLRDWLNSMYKNHSADIYSAFVKRAELSCLSGGTIAMVTMQNWLFSSSFETMRVEMLNRQTLNSMVHIGVNSFPELNSKVAQASAFSIINKMVSGYVTRYLDLASEGKSIDKQVAFLNSSCEEYFEVSIDKIKEIPGYPIAYWVSDSFRRLFTGGSSISKVAFSKQGLATGENARFIRAWYEVSCEKIGFNCANRDEALNSGKKWFPHLKGGDFRRWYGNHEYVVDWSKDGEEIRSFGLDSGKKLRSRPQSMEFYFKPCLTWSDVTTGKFSSRYVPEGYIFSTVGPALFKKTEEGLVGLLGYTNSVVFQRVLDVSLQGLHYNNGVIGNRPYIPLDENSKISKIEKELVAIAKEDWDAMELSWDFQKLTWSMSSEYGADLCSAWSSYAERIRTSIERTGTLEKENNEIFIKAYDLQGELTSEVAESQITLSRANREKDCQRLISYVVGLMMGRYSLDAPGLIYANAANIGFDASRYNSFPADADGILPLTDELWFEDEAASRVREFLLAAWGPDTLAENMAWLAESLGAKAGETPDETIRRYLADKFYRDHLQTYKKRPIYWLFSSGKQGAFQALVYVHRYHEGTLSRMRAEYVVPLTGKIQSRIDLLQQDAVATSSTATRNKLAKEVEKLKKKHVELLAYDEQLRHYADMRITLDLDDGVKANYGKFGNLLAEVKAVTGGTSDD
jgi:hypothetical protein